MYSKKLDEWLQANTPAPLTNIRELAREAWLSVYEVGGVPAEIELNLELGEFLVVLWGPETKSQGIWRKQPKRSFRASVFNSETEISWGGFVEKGKAGYKPTYRHFDAVRSAKGGSDYIGNSPETEIYYKVVADLRKWVKPPEKLVSLPMPDWQSLNFQGDWGSSWAEIETTVCFQSEVAEMTQPFIDKLLALRK